jgi:hypothetical protein
MSDPRFTDPRLSDPVLRREEGVSGTWGWIAGIAVIALVAFLVIAGWNSNSNTANNVSPSTLNPPTTTGSASPPMGPRTTTGSGATSPQPMTPAAPTLPQSPPKSGGQ